MPFSTTALSRPECARMLTASIHNGFYTCAHASGSRVRTACRFMTPPKSGRSHAHLHTWISGHPHSSLSKSLGGSSGSGSSGASTGLGSLPNTGSAGASAGHYGSGSSLFMDYACNSRFHAYSLARFSTLSALSTSSSSLSSKHGSAQSHEGAQQQSDPTTPEPSSPSLTTSTPALTSSSTSASSDDKEDDHWAVNESYSGHGGREFTSTSPSKDRTQSSDASVDNDNPTKSTLQPSLSSFKDPSSIEASWRRTSDSIPTPSNSTTTLIPPSAGTKAGGLDLSSSTLVQQMLFQDRVPHSERKEDEENKEDKVNKDVGCLPQFVECINKHIIDSDPSTETKATTGSTQTLTSMLLNQPSPESEKKSSEKKSPQTAVPEEEDHISKLDIRVGIVRSVENHPDAESLYIEQVDVGDKDGESIKEPRTIVSGLVRHIPKDYLNGRAVIVVANMKPSKLRGVMSQGMLLCAMEQDDKGEVTKVALLEPAEGSQPGDKVTFEGFTDQDTVPAPVLTPKRKWFEKARTHFLVQDGVAYYKGSPFRTEKGKVLCKTISKGQIS